MLGIMATGCIFAKSEKGRGRKIIFPHRVGSVTFFGETRDTILSTGEEIRSPPRSSRSGPILAKMPCTKSVQDLWNWHCG